MLTCCWVIISILSELDSTAVTCTKVHDTFEDHYCEDYYYKDHYCEDSKVALQPAFSLESRHERGGLPAHPSPQSTPPTYPLFTPFEDHYCEDCYYKDHYCEDSKVALQPAFSLESRHERGGLPAHQSPQSTPPNYPLSPHLRIIIVRIVIIRIIIVRIVKWRSSRRVVLNHVMNMAVYPLTHHHNQHRQPTRFSHHHYVYVWVCIVKANGYRHSSNNVTLR